MCSLGFALGGGPPAPWAPRHFDIRNVFRCFQFFIHAQFVGDLLANHFKNKLGFFPDLVFFFGGGGALPMPAGPKHSTRFFFHCFHFFKHASFVGNLMYNRPIRKLWFSLVLKFILGGGEKSPPPGAMGSQINFQNGMAISVSLRGGGPAIRPPYQSGPRFLIHKHQLSANRRPTHGVTGRGPLRAEYISLPNSGTS